MNTSVDECNNTYHHSINKKPINDDYSDLTRKIDTHSKVPKFKVNDRVRIKKYKNLFGKAYAENREFLLSLLFWKLNLGHKKIKNLNGKKIIGSFYEKEFLCNIL